MRDVRQNLRGDASTTWAFETLLLTRLQARSRTELARRLVPSKFPPRAIDHLRELWRDLQSVGRRTLAEPVRLLPAATEAEAYEMSAERDMDPETDARVRVLAHRFVGLAHSCRERGAPTEIVTEALFRAALAVAVSDLGLQLVIANLRQAAEDFERVADDDQPDRSRPN